MQHLNTGNIAAAVSRLLRLLLGCYEVGWKHRCPTRCSGSSSSRKIILLPATVMLIIFSSFCLLIRHMLLLSCFPLSSPQYFMPLEVHLFSALRVPCCLLSKHNFLSFDTPPPFQPPLCLLVCRAEAVLCTGPIAGGQNELFRYHDSSQVASRAAFSFCNPSIERPLFHIRHILTCHSGEITGVDNKTSDG